MYPVVIRWNGYSVGGSAVVMAASVFHSTRKLERKIEAPIK